ncbi:MAG: ABC transporter permease, partial [Bacteroidales bacterium]|nr:ABC transporter permease [Bacteroidales bacterium]
HERIYRVAVDGRMSGDFFNAAVSPAPLAPTLKSEYPEVKNAVRIRNISQEALLSNIDKKFYQSDLIMADSSFFDIFDFKPKFGELHTALYEPLSIVITSSMAQKFFGELNPVGEIIELNNEFNLRITAVIEDIPNNTHFDFPAVISWASIDKIDPSGNQGNWGSLAFYTYIKLAENTDEKLFESKIEKVIMKKIIIESGESPEIFENFQMEFNAFLQPLADIHLHSNLMAELSQNSSISYVYTFSAIAIFILLIACINFMNLTTARSARRAKEVGIRKVHGAVKRQLVYQFISESVILSLFTLIIALLMVEIFLPYFGEIVGRRLDRSVLSNPVMIAKYAALAIVVGFIAGSYPAFYLSSFKPASVIKGFGMRNRQNVSLRNILVIFQFAISIFLIIGTGIINEQIDFVQNSRLGFDKERVLIVELRNQRLRENVNILKHELKKIPAVEFISASTLIPGAGSDGSAYFPEGQSANDPWLIFHAGIDFDYIYTMGMEMLRGRNFSPEFSTDSNAVIINKTLWQKLGWGEDVIGKKIKPGDPMNEFSYHVIGVVDDFHFASLHDKVEPFLFYLPRFDLRNLCIRLEKGDIKVHLANINDAWNRLEPEFPFEYEFLDQSFHDLYNAEIRLSKMYVYFTIIAIFIACLGLFGLSSYLAEQRTKEIGIRKTFGANAVGLAIMLTRDFTKWIVLANFIAWPLAYFMMEEWLLQFAYRINIAENWDIFIYAGLVSFFIAIITVSFQAFRAASANPAASLKYE